MKKLIVFILLFMTSCGKPVPKNADEQIQNNCKEPIELNKQKYD